MQKLRRVPLSKASVADRRRRAAVRLKAKTRFLSLKSLIRFQNCLKMRSVRSGIVAGKKDCAKPGSEAPRFISSAADVLSLLGSGDASERAYARATTETSLRAALPDGFSKLENNNKNSAPSEDQTPETLSAKTKRSTKSRKPQQTLLQRAIASLSRREYSRLELKRKLARTLSEGETKESIEAVLDTAREAGVSLRRALCRHQGAQRCIENGRRKNPTRAQDARH